MAVNFKRRDNCKRGSVYVEASMVMPLTCFILLALVGIIMAFHGEFSKQINAHTESIKHWDCSKELVLIRNYERFIDWI